MLKKHGRERGSQSRRLAFVTSSGKELVMAMEVTWILIAGAWDTSRRVLLLGVGCACLQ